MGSVFLLAIYFLLNIGSGVCNKLCSQATAQSGSCGHAVFMLINSVTACLFFWISNGFSLRLNVVTFWYSTVFAVVVLGTLLVGLYIFRYYSIAVVTVISSAGSLISGALIGKFLFDECLMPNDIVRIVLMLVAVILVFLSVGSGSDKIKKGGSMGLVLIVLRIGFGSAAMAVQKYFAIDVRVTDENSFFFLTNTILLIGAIPWLILSVRKNGSQFDGICQALGTFKLVFVGNTLCSNIQSWITVVLLQIMAVSLYVPVTTALGIIAGVLCSIIFREKVNSWMWVATLTSVLAVIL